MYRQTLTLCVSALLSLAVAGLADAQTNAPYPGVQGNPLDYGRFGPHRRAVVPYGPAVTINRYSPPSAENSKAPPPKKRDEPLSYAQYQDHEPMLEGLWNLQLRETRIHRKDIINVRRRMPLREVLALIESVDADPRVFVNAERLTLRLQAGGLLHAGDRVVGYSDGKVYAILGSVWGR